MSALRWLGRAVGTGLTAVLLLLVRGYQLLISPMIAPRCRFYPSCSAYAVQALQTHGPIRGTWLSARRLGRCHPWNPGGVDLVPPRKGSASAGSTTDSGVHRHPSHSEDHSPC